jgi:hypothetical protein
MKLKFVKLHQIDLGANRTVYVNPAMVKYVAAKSESKTYVGMGDQAITVEGSVDDVLLALESGADPSSSE